MLSTHTPIAAALLGAIAASFLCLSGALAQDTVSLSYKVVEGTPQTYTITLNQTLDVQLGGAGHKVSNDLEGKMVWTLTGADKDGGNSIGIEFGDISAKLVAGGKPLKGGNEFAGEGALRMNMGLAADGAQSGAVLKKVNPQSDRMLRLLRDAFVRNLPEFPKEPVSVGQSWTRSSESKEAIDGGEVTSTFKRTFALTGTEPGKAKVSVQVEIEVVSRVEGESGTVERRSTISGKGVVVFGTASGQILSQTMDLSLESKGAKGEPAQTGTLKLGLTKATP